MNKVFNFNKIILLIKYINIILISTTFIFLLYIIFYLFLSFNYLNLLFTHSDIFLFSLILFDLFIIFIFIKNNKSLNINILYLYIALFILLEVPLLINGFNNSIILFQDLDYNQCFIVIFLGMIIYFFTNKGKYLSSKIFNNNLLIINSKINNKSKYSILLIFLLFLLIKLLIPYFYQGSYIDEYFHILHGINIFNNLETNYIRGLPITFLCGLLINLFGNELFILKLIPAVIGIINFLLLYKISKYFFNNYKYTSLLLAIYTISPWIIFNHFYIRFYVLYELLLLLSIYIYFIVNNSIAKKRLVLSLLSIIIFIVFNVLLFFIINDSGFYMIIIFNCFLIFFLVIKSILILSNAIIKNIFKYFFYILITFFFFYLLFNNKFNYLIKVNLANTNYEINKYEYFFFYKNIGFTILFILSIFIALKHLNKKGEIKSQNIIFIASFLILIIHLISSSDLQLIRSIVYFIPLFYLVAIYSLKHLNIKSIYKYPIMLFLFLTIFNNYPSKFFSDGPYIPSEVFYRRFKESFDFIKNNCDDYFIINLTKNHYVSSFYDINEYYLINSIYYNNPLSVNYDNKFINYEKYKNKIRKNENICYLYSHLWSVNNKNKTYQSIRRYLKNNYDDKISFGNFEVFIFLNKNNN